MHALNTCRYLMELFASICQFSCFVNSWDADAADADDDVHDDGVDGDEYDGYGDDDDDYSCDDSYKQL